MCFTPERGQWQASIAEADKLVFKVLRVLGNEKLTGPYYEHSWTPGLHNTLNNQDFAELILNSMVEGALLGKGGFHSYDCLERAKEEKATLDKWDLFGGKFSIAKMTIPKGSMYLRADGEYFSNSLYFPKNQ